MTKDNSQFSLFDGVSTTSSLSTLPLQTLPDNQKTKAWKKATVDAIETRGLEQVHRNLIFREWRAMAEGRFTYLGTGISDFQELPWFDKEVRKLRSDMNMDTYIKHFDFIGIVVNAMASVYSELDDKYRIDSIDEYSTNEYIRQKTEMLHQYAKQTFISELNRLLTIKGFDPFKEDFESEEEAQQYQQQLEEEKKALTPQEIESFLSKNFKVLATEWAQNVLTADKKRFYLAEQDKEDFISFLLTGRYFRHYRIGYDNYEIESWSAEETFFSEDKDIRYPQKAEFVGKISYISVADILNKYGHMMTYTQQKKVGNYWNQSKNDWQNAQGGAQIERDKISAEKMAFPEPTTVPFHNYFDHKINLQFEEALGVPLAQTTIIDDDGNEESFSSWIPRMDEETAGHNSNFTQYLRDDINVRRDTVRITEGYWRGQKRWSILIYKNELGSISVELVDDNLIKDFSEVFDIKKLNNISLQDLQKALKNGNLEDYENTLTEFYLPEYSKFVKIKGNGSTIKEDLYLDVKPMDFQIKGDSEYYDVSAPVSGIIDTGVTPKLEPYQQLHNICMNQITELLEKELGVFFTFDITGLSEEYQDETTEEAILRIRDNIKDTSLLGLDLSRQNTGPNQPKLFERQEVVFATQVQYRQQMAEYYKQQGMSQVGITPNILGQPTTYETAEGVKQGAQASYALLNPWFDKFNISKAKGMEVQLAVAQFCEVNGKSAHVMTRKGDGELKFLDIIKEDGEIFPMRALSVHPETGSADRKTIEMIKQYIVNNNTIEAEYDDVISILTNPVLTEIQQQAKEIVKKKDKRLQEDRQFQQGLQQQQIEANKEADTLRHEREKEIEHVKGDYKIKSEYIDSLGKGVDKETDRASLDYITKAAQQEIDNSNKDREFGLKEQDNQRKVNTDAESKKIELQKLALKSEELRIKEKSINKDLTTSIINKN
jgi:hypothetical protein